MSTAYELAREAYAAEGIDTEAVLAKLAGKAISVNCWQGDDVMGFDQKDNAASGGIMTTGNYPGRARTFEELTADFEKACSLIPGKKRINLHASYAIFTDENPWVDRDQIEYKHFEPWVALGQGARLRHRLQPHAVQPSHGQGGPDGVLARQGCARLLDPPLHRVPQDRRAHRRGA